MSMIGAQMYTLREQCKTPSDIARSCARVKKMGYDGIQASGGGFKTIDAHELKKILDGEGLICAASHTNPIDASEEEIRQTIEWHQVLDCRYTAIGGLFGEDRTSRAGWEQFVDRFNEAARNLGPSLQLGYHNHDHEFARIDGMCPMQMLIDRLDANAWFELDTYWIAFACGDPVQWIDRVKGRIPCVHYKDGHATLERQALMCEIGHGNLNWPAINAACADAGVEWYLVERDSGLLDPFDSLEISIRNMRDMGL
jgi:sugar phosphate isomerase/epimerase